MKTKTKTKDFIYEPKARTESDDWREYFDGNMKRLVECDKMAKKAGSIVGQYYRQAWADGYAFYQAVEEKTPAEGYKHQVMFKAVTGIGDDWMPFGEKFVVSYHKAKTLVERDPTFGWSKGTMLSKAQRADPESYMD